MYRFWGVAAVVLVLAGCTAAGPAPVGSPSPPAVDYSSLPAEFVGNGKVPAGTVQPGTYEEETPSGVCKWYKGVNGKLTNSGDGPLVLVAIEDDLELEGCSVFVRIG